MICTRHGTNSLALKLKTNAAFENVPRYSPSTRSWRSCRSRAAIWRHCLPPCRPCAWGWGAPWGSRCNGESEGNGRRELLCRATCRSHTATALLVPPVLPGISLCVILTSRLGSADAQGHRGRIRSNGSSSRSVLHCHRLWDKRRSHPYNLTYRHTRAPIHMCTCRNTQCRHTHAGMHADRHTHVNTHRHTWTHIRSTHRTCIVLFSSNITMYVEGGSSVSGLTKYALKSVLFSGLDRILHRKKTTLHKKEKLQPPTLSTPFWQN